MHDVSRHDVSRHDAVFHCGEDHRKTGHIGLLDLSLAGGSLPGPCATVEVALMYVVYSGVNAWSESNRVLTHLSDSTRVSIRQCIRKWTELSLLLNHGTVLRSPVPH